MKQIIKNFLNRRGWELRRLQDPRSLLRYPDGEILCSPDPECGGGLMVVDQDRYFLYDVLSAAYGLEGVRPVVAELGVLRGENASELFHRLNPSALYLIDAWSSNISETYSTRNGERTWASPASDFADYYGGNVTAQATFDRLYSETCSRFENERRVQILRSTTSDGLESLKVNCPEGVDLIYVDAGHDYEQVLDDLMKSAEALRKDRGALILNDCCHSVPGVKQNLGVLEAAYKFCRMAGYRPLLAVNRNWTDAVLVRSDSRLVGSIRQLMLGSAIRYVEVPTELFPNLRLTDSQLPSISFCY